MERIAFWHFSTIIVNCLVLLLDIWSYLKYEKHNKLPILAAAIDARIFHESTQSDKVWTHRFSCKCTDVTSYVKDDFDVLF